MVGWAYYLAVLKREVAVDEEPLRRGAQKLGGVPAGSRTGVEYENLACDSVSHCHPSLALNISENMGQHAQVTASISVRHEGENCTAVDLVDNSKNCPYNRADFDSIIH